MSITPRAHSLPVHVRHAARQIALEGWRTFYLLDLDAIKHRFVSARSAFQRNFHLVTLAYSYKTNNLKAVTHVVRTLGGSAEVVSGAEFQMATEDGFLGSQIYFNGPAKSREDLTRALLAGARINADSLSELASIVSVAKRVDKKPSVGVRVAARYHAGLSRFGLTQEDLREGLDLLDRHGIPLAGIHIHVGSNLRGPEDHIWTLATYLPKVSRYFTEREEPFALDIGGGLPALSFDSTNNPPDVAEFSNAVANELRRQSVSPASIRLVVEPGRHIVEDAGYLATTVAGTKVVEGRNIATVVAGTNLVRSIRNWHHPTYLIANEERGGATEYDIFGSNCFEQDLFVQAYQGSGALEVGDLFVVGSAGGYDLPSANVWIDPAPPVFGLREGNWMLARRPQSVNQMRELHVSA